MRYCTHQPSRAALFCVALQGIVPPAASAAGFVLASPDVGPGMATDSRVLFNGFGCSGGNQSPALQWSGAPDRTRSDALTLYDPDAPTGRGWWHWVVVNLPARTAKLPVNAGAAGGAAMPPAARQITTDFGSPGYGGPCPPEGHAHRYQLTLTRWMSDGWTCPPTRRRRWQAS